MSRIFYCDACKTEITPENQAPWAYLKSIDGEVEVNFNVEIKGWGGWPIDICGPCLRNAIKAAEWVIPADIPESGAK